MNRWIAIAAGVVLVVGGVVAWFFFGPTPSWVVTADTVTPASDHVAFDLSLDGLPGSDLNPQLEIRCDNHKFRVAMHMSDIQRLGDGDAYYPAEEDVSDRRFPDWRRQFNWNLASGSSALQRPEPAVFIRELAAHSWFYFGHGTNSDGTQSYFTFHVQGLDAYLPKLEAYCQLTDEADAEEAENVMSELGTFITMVHPPTVDIYFEFTRTVATPEALEAIKIAAQKIRDAGVERVVVIGHADTLEGVKAGWDQALQDCLNTGEGQVPSPNGYTCPTADQTARRISVLRAQAVVDALVKFGIPREHLTAIGVATDDAAVETKPQTQEPLNRRVSIVIR